MKITGYECFSNGTIKAKKMNISDRHLIEEIKKICAGYRIRSKLRYFKYFNEKLKRTSE
ncbi:hypothetical protein [Hydrogenimonas sp.]